MEFYSPERTFYYDRLPRLDRSPQVPPPALRQQHDAEDSWRVPRSSPPRPLPAPCSPRRARGRLQMTQCRSIRRYEGHEYREVVQPSPALGRAGSSDPRPPTSGPNPGAVVPQTPEHPAIAELRLASGMIANPEDLADPTKFPELSWPWRWTHVPSTSATTTNPAATVLVPMNQETQQIHISYYSRFPHTVDNLPNITPNSSPSRDLPVRGSFAQLPSIAVGESAATAHQSDMTRHQVPPDQAQNHLFVSTKTPRHASPDARRSMRGGMPQPTLHQNPQFPPPFHTTPAEGMDRAYRGIIPHPIHPPVFLHPPPRHMPLPVNPPIQNPVPIQATTSKLIDGAAQVLRERPEMPLCRDVSPTCFAGEGNALGWASSVHGSGTWSAVGGQRVGQDGERGLMMCEEVGGQEEEEEEEVKEEEEEEEEDDEEGWDKIDDGSEEEDEEDEGEEEWEVIDDPREDMEGASVW